MKPTLPTIRHPGTIKWFNAEKRRGIITPDDRGGDVLLSDKRREYSEGQAVTFRMKIRKSGKMEAKYVRLRNA
jgi:cold shock CspA family protein